MDIAVHVYDSACDATCNVCNTSREVPHAFDNNCDADCSLCGVTREVAPRKDENGNGACDVCAVAMTAQREVPANAIAIGTGAIAAAVLLLGVILKIKRK